ncbi:beta/gamma crystallin domain-containing protein [Kitasatospora sp. NPDC088548]|uniref:beta/gamma crystallin domain-containing protein n=1 Tax=Kitasatospora sp. NPDC088548 TaxID=3364075 RepID=UPI0037FAF9CF
MALRKRIAALAIAGSAALAGTVVAAGPAAAIDRVDTNTCNSRSDFFTLWNYPPKVCFAGDGAANVEIFDVYQVNSGNNNSYFNWQSTNGGSYQSHLGNGYYQTFDPRVKVTWIYINGR